MGVLDSSELLRTAALLTEQQDQRALEQSLLDALMEFLPLSRATVYAESKHEDAYLLTCRVDRARRAPKSADSVLPITPALIRCLEGVEVTGELEGEVVGWYPLAVQSSPRTLLAVHFEQDAEIDPTIIRAMVRICTNFLSVLDRSQRDTLTGLLNRQTFDRQLMRISQTETEAPRWLAVLDIDHFKRINDTYGHLYGDEVLILMARIMDQCFRGADLKFRYGGEEFVVVLSPTHAEGAMLALERFREEVAHYDFPQVGRVSVSIGVTRLLPSGDVHALFECADKALYFAKANGRNQVRFYETLVADGDLAAPTAVAAVGDIELF